MQIDYNTYALLQTYRYLQSDTRTQMQTFCKELSVTSISLIYITKLLYRDTPFLLYHFRTLFLMSFEYSIMQMYQNLYPPSAIDEHCRLVRNIFFFNFFFKQYCSEYPQPHTVASMCGYVGRKGMFVVEFLS